LWASAPATAQPTHDYYTSHAARTAAPRQLDQAAREYYAAVFAAIDRRQFAARRAAADRGLAAERPQPAASRAA
jgi:hypothetical protein